MELQVETRLVHKSLGRCRVTNFNAGNKFTVAFHDGKPGLFRIADADTFFTEDTLPPKYKIFRPLDAETATLLEAFDSGDFNVWQDLIVKLDLRDEDSAAAFICEKLAELSSPPPSFLSYYKERQLRSKYEIDKDLDKDSTSLLEKFDSGETAVAVELVKKLDVFGEAAAVNLICDRLATANIPLTFFLLTKKGKALRKLKKFDPAVDVANKALEAATSPKEKSIALTTRAAALTDLDRIAEAHKDCEDALAMEPDSYYTRRVLGRVYVKRGNYSEADAQFLLAAGLAGIDTNSIEYGFKDYIARVKEFKQESRRGDIEQIIEHIKSKWPTELADRALKVISTILQAL